MTPITPPPHRLFLVRHAQAVWPEPTMRDYDRLLSARGEIDAGHIAGRLAAAGYKPDLILSSSAMRCRQTADAAYRALGRTPRVQFSDDLYQAAPITYIEMIEEIDSYESIMVVGHNPGIEEILLMLIGYEAFNRACPYGYPTAGVAVLDFTGLSEGKPDDSPQWKLTEFLTP
ncbi:histidine phosphatase family protein [Martelella sp. HB161492]|uniref:SixA phosphatase family protein n=1 Tax=Martelella sp. HB161492 TaxID=2720726 RepID=UPI00159219E2|nr:histidine phosphatase family protein [Martelella sp. HB161492]